MKPTQLRDAGIARATANSSDGVREAANIILDGLILAGDPFNADDVRSELDDLGLSFESPRAMGGVFLSAAKRGRIKRTGAVRYTTERSQHAHPHPLWIAA